MNLISRLTLIFALASLFIFLGGGIITFRVMEREINIEQELFLLERLEEVKRFIERRQPDERVNRPKIIIEPVSTDAVAGALKFSDTLVTHATLDRIEPHLKLETIAEVDQKKYRIVVYDIIVESDDIVDGVVESLLIIFSILLVTLIAIGALSSYLVLRPFDNTLSFIQNFSIAKGGSTVSLKKTNLPEIKKLNLFLENMTQQVTHEYDSLKEFSENASHELKTPLAIIQGKVEYLINDPLVTKDQMEQLGAIQNTLNRLKRLSDAMVLLTKIDNNEFSEREEVNLSLLILNLMHDFSELIDLKSISLESSITENVIVFSHKTLLEVMLSNLIINAIKYNELEGSLHIILEQEKVIIKNSGKPLTVAPEMLFARFKKSNTSDQSLGLGLAIVKKICDFSGFTIEYLNNSKHHTVSIGLASA